MDGLTPYSRTSAGLRISEGLAIMCKDLDAKNGMIRVLHGKNDKARVVGLDSGAWAILQLWLDRRAAAGISNRAPVFCTLQGKPMKSAYVRALLPRLARKAGIDKRVYAHGLRHTHAFELACEGITGPEASGKTMFHDAMGLLLPAKGVVHVPGDFWTPKDNVVHVHGDMMAGRLLALSGFHFSDSEARDQLVSPAEWSRASERMLDRQREREIKLDNAWLVVVNDIPAAYVRLFEKPRYRDGRFLKWSLAYDHVVRPLPNTIHFDLKQPAILVPKMDFIRRLEDERDAFQQTLRNYAA